MTLSHIIYEGNQYFCENFTRTWGNLSKENCNRKEFGFNKKDFLVYHKLSGTTFS